MLGRPRVDTVPTTRRTPPAVPKGPANGYPTLAEHPVRCPATFLGLTIGGVPVGDHVHECAHPAKLPDGVVGILEHRCRHCGCTWTEGTQRPAPDTSWIQMEGMKR